MQTSRRGSNLSPNRGALLPPELARRISQWTVNGADMAGAVGKTAFMTIAVFLLSGYAPAWTGNADYNGFLLLLGPWVCPGFVALLWSARLARLPFRVYQGSPFGNRIYVDTGGDPVAMHLVQIYKSDEARRHLWQETLRLSIILFVILGVAAILQRDSLNWAYPSPENRFLFFFPTNARGVPGEHFWFGLFGCCLFLFIVLTSDYYRWCLVTWAKREASGT